MSHKSSAKSLWRQSWGPKSPSLPFLPVLSPLTVCSLCREQGCVLEKQPDNPTPAVRTPGIQIYWNCIARARSFFYTLVAMVENRRFVAFAEKWFNTWHAVSSCAVMINYGWIDCTNADMAELYHCIGTLWDLIWDSSMRNFSESLVLMQKIWTTLLETFLWTTQLESFLSSVRI